MGGRVGDGAMIDVAVSFFAAMLSGTGVGGGGLLMIYLGLAKDVPQLAAQGINLLFFESAAAGALPVHFAKRNIPRGAAVFLGTAGLVGAVIGAFIAKSIEPTLLRKFFGAFLIVSGVISLFKKQRRDL